MSYALSPPLYIGDASRFVETASNNTLRNGREGRQPSARESNVHLLVEKLEGRPSTKTPATHHFEDGSFDPAAQKLQQLRDEADRAARALNDFTALLTATETETVTLNRKRITPFAPEMIEGLTDGSATDVSCAMDVSSETEEATSFISDVSSVSDYGTCVSAEDVQHISLLSMGRSLSAPSSLRDAAVTPPVQQQLFFHDVETFPQTPKCSTAAPSTVDTVVGAAHEPQSTSAAPWAGLVPNDGTVRLTSAHVHDIQIDYQCTTHLTKGLQFDSVEEVLQSSLLEESSLPDTPSKLGAPSKPPPTEEGCREEAVREMLIFVAEVFPHIRESCRAFDDNFNRGKHPIAWRVHHMHLVHRRGRTNALHHGFWEACKEQSQGEVELMSGSVAFSECMDRYYWDNMHIFDLLLNMLEPQYALYEQLIRSPDQRYTFDSFLLMCTEFAISCVTSDNMPACFPEWSGKWQPQQVPMAPRAQP